MIDLLSTNSVEIQVDSTGKLWINIDGKCTLRIGHAKLITVDDPIRGLDEIYSEDREDPKIIARKIVRELQNQCGLYHISAINKIAAAIENARKSPKE